MSATIDDCWTQQPTYSLFELFECAMIFYLNAADAGMIAVGSDGPNTDPKLFRSLLITALSDARDRLETEAGQLSLDTLRQMFRGTQTALEGVRLGHLGTK